MEILSQCAESAALALAYGLIVLLCLAGLVLSCVSISGTWLVTAAAVVAALLRGDAFPGLWTIIVFILVSTAVEVLEAIASAWGVTKRGGSKLAGVAALVGGLAGLILGGMIPIPILGGLLGMMAGSFLLVFAVERHRLKKSSPAAHIAMGSVISRVLVILVKVGATLAMAAILIIGMFLG